MEKDDRYTRITLRIPKDLHEALSMAADNTSKSMNAEIIARLEASTIKIGGTLVPAAKARELAEIARQALPEVIRQRVQEAISRAIGLGHSAADVELDDLGLEGGMSEKEIQSVLGGIDSELLQAGYKVEWNGPSGATIFF